MGTLDEESPARRMLRHMEARSAVADDMPALLEMIRDFFAWESIPFDAAQIESALQRLLSNADLGNVWIFEAHREKLGYAIVTFGFDLEFNGRDALLTDFFLKPAWRDRGQGRHALQLVLHRARESGVHAIHLLVDPKNQRAVRVYEQSGFEHSHRIAMTKMLV
jgi:RimJ/RimL family protein N-acetyltransferase